MDSLSDEDQQALIVLMGILRNTPDPGPTQPDGQPYFPWMQIADHWLATAGFKPGERVSFSIDYRYAGLTIMPDHG